MIGGLAEVVNTLFDLSDHLQQPGNAKRQRIANHFTDIEKCLQDSADQLKNGVVPNSKWGELDTYGWDLPATIGKEIGEEKAKELGRLLVRTASKTPTKEDIQAIEAAAGKFKGLANTIIAKPGGNRSTRRRILTYTAFGAAGLAGGLLIDSLLERISPQPKKGQSSDNPPAGTDPFPLSDINWKMPTFLSNSVRGTILWEAPDRLCKRIKTMTEDRFIITPDRNGETLEILAKVNDGTYECGYSGVYYGDSYKALYFGCAIPFGLNPQEQNAWLYYKKNPNDEETYVQSIYRKVGLENIISFPAGATGAQMGGWFKKEIKSVKDFQGLTMRIPGLGGNILANYFGVRTHLYLETAGKERYPLEKCIEMLKNGEVFDAVEWNGLHDDIILKLHEAANFYYYPGWWEPGTTFDVQVNRNAWDNLPQHYQEIFKVACFETHLEMLAEYNQSNIIALREMPKNINLVKFSDDILQKAKEATDQKLNSLAQESSFNEVYTEWKSFKEQIAWINNVDSIRGARS